MAGADPQQPDSAPPPSTRHPTDEPLAPPTVNVPPAEAHEAPTRVVSHQPTEQETPPGSVPLPGHRLGDFRIREVLGAGSFATVYLAEQVSLGRSVALKVATTEDDEARTLASLEHEHIVPVYSETIDRARGLRLMCMKFVAGTDLEKVQRELAERDLASLGGQAFLDAIDRLCRHEAMFDLAALRDRERLADCDFIEAVCWLGSRLAEALAHAHSRGVLHRDVKPANIMLNRYGRPLLTDFNLALGPLARTHGSFGGTVRYMAPEHLDAFNPNTGIPHEAVDARSDIYSLGVVLWELLAGRQLFPDLPHGVVLSRELDHLAKERRVAPPSVRTSRPDVPVVVDRVVRRCLDPDPDRRYQKGEELARVLEGCRELHQMEREFPPPMYLTRRAQRHPVWILICLTFIPHLLGSVVNVTYNRLRIVETHLSEAQQTTFHHILLGYNLLVYPFCVWLLCRLMVPIMHMRTRLEGPDPVDPEEVARQRRRALSLPGVVVLVSCLGWLPGGLLFPMGIDLWSGPVEAEVYGHFLTSFTVSGLIATTYSYFGVQFFVLRILYPGLWTDPRSPHQQARQELGRIEGRLTLFQFASGLIPLCGAVLMIGSSSAEEFTLVYRLLVLGLIALGMAGFGVALLARDRISRILAVLTGPGDRSRPALTGSGAA